MEHLLANKEVQKKIFDKQAEIIVKSESDLAKLRKENF